MSTLKFHNKYFHLLLKKKKSAILCEECDVIRWVGY